MSVALPETRTLTTKEQWWDFVKYEPPQPPQEPSPTELAAMSKTARRALKLERVAYHLDLEPVPTPAMHRIINELMTQAMANLYSPPGARPGSLIDGAANLGKTTTLLEFGRCYERELRQLYSEDIKTIDEFIPVVYVSLPAAASPKALNELLLEFYGFPRMSRATKTSLTVRIQGLARRCRTSLFLIDDLHFLKLTRKTERDVNDHLKNLASTTSATFVYAGIDCEQSGLLTEGRRFGSRTTSQTANRFTMYTMTPFSISTAAGRDEWRSVLAGVEQRLGIPQPNGVLSKGLAGYLFERTHGEMGSLMALIRAGMVTAITRNKPLTVDLLEPIRLSYAATKAREQRNGSRPTR